MQSRSDLFAQLQRQIPGFENIPTPKALAASRLKQPFKGVSRSNLFVQCINRDGVEHGLRTDEQAQLASSSILNTHNTYQHLRGFDVDLLPEKEKTVPASEETKSGQDSANETSKGGDGPGFKTQTNTQLQMNSSILKKGSSSNVQINNPNVRKNNLNVTNFQNSMKNDKISPREEAAEKRGGQQQDCTVKASTAQGSTIPIRYTPVRRNQENKETASTMSQPAAQVLHTAPPGLNPNVNLPSTYPPPVPFPPMSIPPPVPTATWPAQPVQYGGQNNYNIQSQPYQMQQQYPGYPPYPPYPQYPNYPPGPPPMAPGMIPPDPRFYDRSNPQFGWPRDGAYDSRSPQEYWSGSRFNDRSNSPFDDSSYSSYDDDDGQFLSTRGSPPHRRRRDRHPRRRSSSPRDRSHSGSNRSRSLRDRSCSPPGCSSPRQTNNTYRYSSARDGPLSPKSVGSRSDVNVAQHDGDRKTDIHRTTTVGRSGHDNVNRDRRREDASSRSVDRHDTRKADRGQRGMEVSEGSKGRDDWVRSSDKDGVWRTARPTERKDEHQSAGRQDVYDRRTGDVHDVHRGDDRRTDVNRGDGRRDDDRRYLNKDDGKRDMIRGEDEWVDTRRTMERGDDRRDVNRGDGGKTDMNRGEGRRDVNRGDGRKDVNRGDDGQYLNKGNMIRGDDGWVDTRTIMEIYDRSDVNRGDDGRRNVNRDDGRRDVNRDDGRRNVNRGDDGSRDVNRDDGRGDVNRGDDGRKDVNRGDDGRRDLNRSDGRRNLNRGDDGSRYVNKGDDGRRDVNKGDGRRDVNRGDDGRIDVNRGDDGRREVNRDDGRRDVNRSDDGRRYVNRDDGRRDVNRDDERRNLNKDVIRGDSGWIDPKLTTMGRGDDRIDVIRGGDGWTDNRRTDNWRTIKRDENRGDDGRTNVNSNDGKKYVNRGDEGRKDVIKGDYGHYGNRDDKRDMSRGDDKRDVNVGDSRRDVNRIDDNRDSRREHAVRKMGDKDASSIVGNGGVNKTRDDRYRKDDASNGNRSRQDYSSTSSNSSKGNSPPKPKSLPQHQYTKEEITSIIEDSKWARDDSPDRRTGISSWAVKESRRAPSIVALKKNYDQKQDKLHSEYESFLKGITGQDKPVFKKGITGQDKPVFKHPLANTNSKSSSSFKKPATDATSRSDGKRKSNLVDDYSSMPPPVSETKRSKTGCSKQYDSSKVRDSIVDPSSSPASQKGFITRSGGNQSVVDKAATESSIKRNQIAEAIAAGIHGKTEQVSIDEPRPPRLGEKVNELIVNFVRTAFQSKGGVHIVAKKYKLPRNCIGLVPPKMTQEMWSILKKAVQLRDNTLQDVQRWLALGVIPIILQIDMFGNGDQQAKDVCRMTSDSITVLGHVCRNMSIKRRLVMRSSLNKKYAVLCRTHHDLSQYIFGNNLAKNLMEIRSGSYRAKPSPDVDNDDLEAPNYKPTFFAALAVPQSDVDANVANMINMACANDGDVDDLKEKFKIPSNCDLLIPSKINPEIWSLLSTSGIELDYRLQDVQLSVSESMVPLMRILESVYEKRYEPCEALGMLTDALALLGNTIFQLNKVRMDAMLKNLPTSVHGFSQWYWPGAEQVSGERLEEELSACRDSDSSSRAVLLRGALQSKKMLH